MAKYPLYLLLLLSLLRTSDVQANCYASSWTNGMPTFGSIYANGNDTLQSCQALACSIWSTMQGCPQATPVCTTTFIEKTESCQPNYSGQRKSKQETQTCTNGQTTVYPWQVYSDTCTPNPPSCQVSTQTQSLSCQTGYVGSITQVQSSVCSNPYAQPVWSGTWITTQNTCVKSVTNPTNVTSPVSPVSPLNPTSALTTQAPTATAPQTTAPSNQTTTAGSDALTVGSSAPSSTAQTDAKGTASQTTASAIPTPKTPFTIKTVPLALSLELFVKPSLTQPSVFPDINIGQELPNDIKMMQNIYMDLITNGSLFNPDQSDKLNRIASDAVELEQ